MLRRAFLLLCAVLMAAAWAIFTVDLATRGPLKAPGVFLVCLSIALTWWAASLVARERRGRVGRFAAVYVSGLATAVVLWMVLALHYGYLPQPPSWVVALLIALTILIPLSVLVPVARALIRPVAKALIRTQHRYAQRPRSPRQRARDARLAAKALEARTAKQDYRG